MGSALMALMYIAAGLVSTIYTNKANKSSMQSQQDWNEDMMNKQNEYNLPSNQVQRLQDAGINPTSLGMGQGMQVSGNTSATANPYNLLPMSDPFSMASNSLLSNMSAFKAQQEGKTDMSLRQLRFEQMQVENESLRQQAINWNLSNEAQIILNKYLDAREQYALLGEKANLNLTYSQISELNQKIANMRYELQEIMPADLKIKSLSLDVMLSHTHIYQ